MAEHQQCPCVQGNEPVVSCGTCQGTGTAYYCEGCQEWLAAKKFDDPEEDFLCVDCMEEEEANLE